MMHDVVILDVRSNYEHNLGRFKNAVTLDIENFRDFPAMINELAKYRDKKVSYLLYRRYQMRKGIRVIIARRV